MMASLISIQLNGQGNLKANLAKVEQLIAYACQQADSEKLIVLPECFSLFGVAKKQMLSAAEALGDGLVQSFLSDIAKQYDAYIVGGTTPIYADPSEHDKTRYYAASLVYNPQGKLIARYNKIHLFDVEVNDNTQSYKESASTIAGQHLSLFNTSFAQDIAQSVCYDLRFSDMFSAYAKHTEAAQAPTIIVVPSAFTKTTGAAHWHALLKARSIENQCYVVAANQVGTHADGRQTYGNSCVYSPWGQLSAVQFTDEVSHEGYAITTFDKANLFSIRAKMPVLSHKKERYTLGQ
jgi:predicted amidohydrolase